MSKLEIHSAVAYMIGLIIVIGQLSTTLLAAFGRDVPQDLRDTMKYALGALAAFLVRAPVSERTVVKTDEAGSTIAHTESSVVPPAGATTAPNPTEVK